MYSQGNAILRADLMGVVQEALNAESQYIGTKVFGPLGVPAKAGQYPKLAINSANMLRDEAKRRGPTAAYPRISRAWENDTYTCIEYGLEEAVGDVDKADIGRFFDAEAAAAKLTQRQLLLGHERRASAKLFNTSNWSLSTSATAYTAANLASFDIAYDVDLVKLAIKNRGESVNPADLVAVMSTDVFLRARQSTRLQNRIRGVLSTDTNLVLTPDDVAQALGVREVLIGGGVYDTTKQGATSSSLSNIWSNSYIWVGQAKAGDFFGGGACRTLFWEQDSALVQVESYREEQSRSNIIRVRHFTDEKIINANAGQLLVTQYS